MKVGDTCYILVNNYILKEVVIKRIAGNLYTIKFKDSNKAIRLPKHRLFATKEDAKTSVKGIVYEENELEKHVPKPPPLH